MRHAILGALLLVAAVPAIGCRARTVTKKEMTGTWVGTDIHGHPLTPPATPTIELHSDGTFSARYIPPSGSDPEPSAGSGKWTLPVEDRQQRLLLAFSAGQQGVPAGGYGMSLFVDHHAGQILIIEYLGDPDDGQPVAFVKQ